ncbi:MAG: DUF1653 domain-containing protein [Candidatus Caenarcaniphilales bacterium]|nr:DUF1653 domain-containing protein [Candidatus Caenarcaniphilales bacterium]
MLLYKLLKLGKYQHYKGQFYEVIGEATHTETREELALYKMLYETKDYEFGSLWVRPKNMFLETVVYKGKEVPRFKYVGG